MVAKQSSFTDADRLYGFYYYDLAHPDEDEHFPDKIVKEGNAFNYWGSIMTIKPIEKVELTGSYHIGDYDWYELERGIEVPVPNVNFVTNVHFYDFNFYLEAVAQEQELVIGTSVDFYTMVSILDIIEPFSYPIKELKMNRSWNMPNKNTFEMKAIKKILEEELHGGLIIDPFANRNKYGHITNDLNPHFDTDFHMDALDFLKMFESESVDVVLFDPPYSPRQVKESYESVGLSTDGGRLTRASYWSDMKKEICRILRVGGKAISFGWNSGGMNNKNYFHINRIELVAHGGNHNDTIVTVSVKTKSLTKDEQLSFNSTF